MVKFHKLRCLYKAKFKSLQKFYFDQYLGEPEPGNEQKFNFRQHFLEDEQGKIQPLITKSDFIKILNIKSNTKSGIEITETLGEMETWPEILNLADALEIMIVYDKAKGIDVVSKRIESNEALELELKYKETHIWKRQSSVAVYIGDEDTFGDEQTPIQQSTSIRTVNRPTSIKFSTSVQTFKDLSTRMTSETASIRKSIVEIIQEEEQSESIYKSISMRKPDVVPEE